MAWATREHCYLIRASIPLNFLDYIINLAFPVEMPKYITEKMSKADSCWRQEYSYLHIQPVTKIPEDQSFRHLDIQWQVVLIKPEVNTAEFHALGWLDSRWITNQTCECHILSKTNIDVSDQPRIAVRFSSRSTGLSCMNDSLSTFGSMQGHRNFLPILSVDWAR